MDGHEFYKYSKPCHQNGITIYPVPFPSNNGNYRIVVNKHGKETMGSEIYTDKPYVKEVELKTTMGFQKVKVSIPSLWDKIGELYKDICEKNKLEIK